VSGTTVVKDINPGIADASPKILGSVGNTLFFSANDGTGVWDLWQTEGTEASTQLVQGSTGTKFEYIKMIDNKLFFTTTNARGRDLWVINNAPEDGETDLPVCEAGLDPQTIQAGEGTALWWWSQNATTGSINNGMGDVTVPSDFKWIYPSETTTYTMTAKNASDATTTCEATVIVETENSSPVCEMGADPQVITAGEGSALWWWSQNVASATINNEKWSVSVPSDYTWFYPTETATYTMMAVGENGQTVNCATTIEVTQ
jgi:ELWxxDGT repeat protein